MVDCESIRWGEIGVELVSGRYAKSEKALEGEGTALNAFFRLPPSNKLTLVVTSKSESIVLTQTWHTL
jgi:hypothetical protein